MDYWRNYKGTNFNGNSRRPREPEFRGRYEKQGYGSQGSSRHQYQPRHFGRDPEDKGNLAEHLIPLSREMAHLLRHTGKGSGLCLHSDGWVLLSELATHCSSTDADIWEVVKESHSKDRPRFELAEDVDTKLVYIRATHKHSPSLRANAGPQAAQPPQPPQPGQPPPPLLPPPLEGNDVLQAQDAKGDGFETRLAAQCQAMDTLPAREATCKTELDEQSEVAAGKEGSAADADTTRMCLAAAVGEQETDQAKQTCLVDEVAIANREDDLLKDGLILGSDEEHRLNVAVDPDRSQVASADRTHVDGFVEEGRFATEATAPAEQEVAARERMSTVDEEGVTTEAVAPSDEQCLVEEAVHLDMESTQASMDAETAAVESAVPAEEERLAEESPRIAKERRYSEDGSLYTNPEFLEFFGAELGQKHWESAPPETEELAAPPILELSPDDQIEWMWGDASLIGHGIAELNPLRWSSAKRASDTVLEMGKETGKNLERSVQMVVKRDGKVFKEATFSNINEATAALSLQERRYAADGKAYKKSDFVEFWGQELGQQHWNSAQPETEATAMAESDRLAIEKAEADNLVAEADTTDEANQLKFDILEDEQLAEKEAAKDEANQLAVEKDVRLKASGGAEMETEADSTEALQKQLSRSLDDALASGDLEKAVAAGTDDVQAERLALIAKSFADTASTLKSHPSAAGMQKAASAMETDEDPAGATRKDEDEIFSQFSKLYRFVGNEWEERGTSEAKLLRHRKTRQVRFMFRHDKTMKVLANHLVVDVPPYCDLRPNADGSSCWVWTAQDFADDEMKVENLALKFSASESARAFKEAFENTKNLNKAVIKLQSMARGFVARAKVAKLRKHKATSEIAAGTEVADCKSPFPTPPLAEKTSSSKGIQTPEKKPPMASCITPEKVSPGAPSEVEQCLSPSKPNVSELSQAAAERHSKAEVLEVENVRTERIWLRFDAGEDQGHWWWNELDNDGFMEASPGSWTKYYDPESSQSYWYLDESKWFFVHTGTTLP